MFTAAGIILLTLLAFQLLLALRGQLLRAKISTDQSKLEKQFLQKKITNIIGQSRDPIIDNQAWSGWRKFQVRQIVSENETIKSFYLEPHDGKLLQKFEPGQHLTFRLKVPGKSKPVIRCYSLSDSAHDIGGKAPGCYRVSIRKQAAPAASENIPNGVSSCYFHDEIEELDVLDVKAPAGKFYLDVTEKTPVVLIGGGIGVTPSLSMLNTLHALKTEREIWLIYGVRNKGDLIMLEHFNTLNKAMPNLHVHFFFSDIEERRLTSFLHKGRVSVDRMKALGVPMDADFYICGPQPMMQSIVGGLEASDVDSLRIHFESFGPASLTKSVQKVSAENSEAPSGQEFSITYNVSNKSEVWKASQGTLLESAEALGVDIDSGCRAGSCGTCLTAVLSGKVRYIDEPSVEIEKGCCLPCIAVPTSDMKINA